VRQILLLTAFLIPLFCYSQEYLQTNEKSVFEFETVKGKRLVIALDTNEKYLVYRYGTEKNIELEFPKKLSTSWNEFQFSWYLRGGGVQNEGLDLNYLYFDSGIYRYVVFQEYSSNSQRTDYGIKVINRETKNKTVIEANPTTVEGTLSNFRDVKSIKEGDELFE